MSLKAFHLVFISASVLLSLFAGVWGVKEYGITGSVFALSMGIAFLVLGGALLVYGVRVIAKFRELSAFVLLVLIAEAAMACPVCFGDSDSPMAKGMNGTVWVMLGIIGFVQVGFVALFISFWRRSRALRRKRDQFHLIDGFMR